MSLAGVIPRHGSSPEVFDFYCRRCHEAETIEWSIEPPSGKRTPTPPA